MWLYILCSLKSNGSNCTAALDWYKRETLILNLELLFNVHITKVEKLNSFPLITYRVCVGGGVENMYAHGCTCVYVNQRLIWCLYQLNILDSSLARVLAAKPWGDGQAATPTCPHSCGASSLYISHGLTPHLRSLHTRCCRCSSHSFNCWVVLLAPTHSFVKHKIGGWGVGEMAQKSREPKFGSQHPREVTYRHL